MAQLLFTSAASAAVQSFGLAPNGIAAQILFAGARYAGSYVDEALFGKVQHTGPRLDNLEVQSVTEGKAIPVIYGKVRIAGNVIWAAKLTEIEEKMDQGGGKGGGGRRSEYTQYRYYADMAIAIAEGEIDYLHRIWADHRLLDLSRVNYQFYRGTETEWPDPLMESYLGKDKVPAYQGLCYIVFQQFPLAEYGNRIPNFTFEVERKLGDSNSQGQQVEEQIRAINMIPGSGEFVYDPVIQTKQPIDDSYVIDVNGNPVRMPLGKQARLNQHQSSIAANAEVSLAALKDTCPNVEWVSVVVTWFADSLDIAFCDIYPAVEDNKTTSVIPEDWQVAGISRRAAKEVGKDESGNLRYGGTVSDAALLRYIHLLKQQGLKVMLYPMIFMDVPGKPWRGRMSGSADAIESFFHKDSGYRRFILHYAELTKGQVDAFIIGSELVALNAIHDGQQQFPAVSELQHLASDVRAVMGTEVKLTYAADWSEYHHTEGGWYHLDPLWAHDAIDMVGIDAYFPLTDATESVYDIEQIKAGWFSGEGFDWVRAGANGEEKEPIAPAYAWKNIAYWWQHPHINPDGMQSAWQPQMKPIWFTEFGFPSVSCASNQPNVFYDPTSSESYFPRYSNGQTDQLAQKRAIAASLEAWQGSLMVPLQFLWCWDARPYPAWPDRRDIWRDGGLYEKGHWVQGKMSVSELGSILRDLCMRVGLREQDIDVSQVRGEVKGMVLAPAAPIISFIIMLLECYDLEMSEIAGRLVFRHKEHGKNHPISVTQLVQMDGQGENPYFQHIVDDLDNTLPQSITVSYMDASKQYHLGSVTLSCDLSHNKETAHYHLPMVLEAQQALNYAKQLVRRLQAKGQQIRFSLSLTEALPIDCGDIVHFAGEHPLVAELGGAILRITEKVMFSINHVVFSAIPAISDFAAELVIENIPESEDTDNQNTDAVVTGRVYYPDLHVELLDIPLLPGRDPTVPQLLLAVASSENYFQGAHLYRSYAHQDQQLLLANITSQATLGIAASMLPASYSGSCLWDERNELIVHLFHGELVSATEQAVLAGANAMLVGEEIIQFRQAEMLAPYQYRLSGLLRGRLATETAMENHHLGERVVLLDQALVAIPITKDMMGQPLELSAVHSGDWLENGKQWSITPTGRSFQLPAPVHLQWQQDTKGNVIFSWNRRSRSYHAWPDGMDILQEERRECYQLRAYQGKQVLFEREVLDQSEVMIDKNMLPEQWDKCDWRVQQKGELPISWSS